MFYFRMLPSVFIVLLGCCLVFALVSSFSRPAYLPYGGPFGVPIFDGGWYHGGWGHGYGGYGGAPSIPSSPSTGRSGSSSSRGGGFSGGRGGK